MRVMPRGEEQNGRLVLARATHALTASSACGHSNSEPFLKLFSQHPQWPPSGPPPATLNINVAGRAGGPISGSPGPPGPPQNPEILYVSVNVAVMYPIYKRSV